MAELNLIQVHAAGPLEVRGDVQVAGQDPCNEAWICRCGRSSTKPFCDGSHNSAGFSDPGQPPKDAQLDPLSLDGPLVLKPLPNGPVLVSGEVEVRDAAGAAVKRAKKLALCRCGASSTKPFCDGTHSKVGFTAP